MFGQHELRRVNAEAARKELSELVRQLSPLLGDDGLNSLHRDFPVEYEKLTLMIRKLAYKITERDQMRAQLEHTIDTYIALDTTARTS